VIARLIYTNRNKWWQRCSGVPDKAPQKVEANVLSGPFFYLKIRLRISTGPVDSVNERNMEPIMTANTTTANTTTFTVRPLGCTSWEEGLTSLEAAEASRVEAAQRGLDCVIVNDTTGETVEAE